jgi:hypothetical protein
MATQAITAARVPVYAWNIGGHSIGCGTAAELSHWVSQGIYMEGEVDLGTLIGTEPASLDQRRTAAFKQEAAR